MQKHSKRLRVSGETLRQLATVELADAVGGLPGSRDHTCSLGDCPPEHLVALPGSREPTCGLPCVTDSPK